jgi:UDP-N-acetyl-D-galactosamine dehydrogenase
MGAYVAQRVVKMLVAAEKPVKRARVGIFGLTFKENVPDLRNSRVIDVIRELRSYGMNVHVHDPVADPAEARHEYGIELVSWEALPRGEALVAAVAHRTLAAHDVAAIAGKLVEGGLYVDVKSQADAAALRAHGLNVWRL